MRFRVNLILVRRIPLPMIEQVGLHVYRAHFVKPTITYAEPVGNISNYIILNGPEWRKIFYKGRRKLKSH